MRPSAEGVAFHRQAGQTFEEIGSQYGMQTAEAYLLLRGSGIKDPGVSPPYADCDKCAGYLGVILQGSNLHALRRHLHEDHGVGRT